MTIGGLVRFFPQRCFSVSYPGTNLVSSSCQHVKEGRHGLKTVAHRTQVWMAVWPTLPMNLKRVYDIDS